MNTVPKWIWWAIGGGVLALILLFNSMYTVNERQVAVRLQFGEHVESHTEPGLYFKVPFMQNVERYPKTLQFWRSSPQETLDDLPTADKKKIEVSAWAVWRITDPKKFREVLVNMANAESAVKTRVRAAIRDEITSQDLAEVIRSSDRELTYSLLLAKPEAIDQDDAEGNAAVPLVPGIPEDGNPIGAEAAKRITMGREKIMQKIRESVQKRLKGEEGTDNDVDRGIELVDVGIHDIAFVPAVREAAFERLKTAMEAIAAMHFHEGSMKKELILNETRAQVQKITGEGEGESSRIRGEIDAKIITEYAEAINETGDFYNFERTLKLYEQSLSGKSNRLILTTDSELFRLLKELDKPGPPPTMPPATGEEAETVEAKKDSASD